MAKFFKSIFHSSDKKKTSYEVEGEEDKNEVPPADVRKRHLSISKSGRMRQANKKRHSLTLELYGDINTDQANKNKSMEYHVHGQLNKTAPAILSSNNRLDENIDNKRKAESDMKHENTNKVSLEKELSTLTIEKGSKSPEEEIDSAFEILDKT